MKALSTWTPRRVVLACVLWLLGAPVLAALGLVLGGLVLAAIPGKRSLAVSANINDWSLAWLLLPPILLVGAWIWSRERVRGQTNAIDK